MNMFWEMTIDSKLLQPISKILVSFFSENNVLSDKIKVMKIEGCYIFEYGGGGVMKIEVPHFGGTPGIFKIHFFIYSFIYQLIESINDVFIVWWTMKIFKGENDINKRYPP